MKFFVLSISLNSIFCSSWPAWDQTKICDFAKNKEIYHEEYDTLDGIDCESVCAKYGYYQVFWDPNRYLLSDSLCCGQE